MYCYFILLFYHYLTFELGVPLQLYKLESPSPKDYLSQVRLKLAKLFWRRFSKVVNLIFIIFQNISTLGRAWHFTWRQLNPLHPGILCAMIGWNCHSGSEEEDENVKRLPTDGRTDRRRTTVDQKSSL